MPQLFNRLDKNKDGLLTKLEMKTLFIEDLQVQINEKEFEEFFGSFDID